MLAQLQPQFHPKSRLVAKSMNLRGDAPTLDLCIHVHYIACHLMYLKLRTAIIITIYLHFH